MLKPRREGRVCFRLAELKKQYQQTLHTQQSCIAQSNELSLLLEKMLSWSGNLAPRELRMQKQKIASIHVKQQHLTLQQQSLMLLLQQLQTRQEELVAELQNLLNKRSGDIFSHPRPLSDMGDFNA
ncbi:hypothetical protein NG42_13385 [Winslowiella iniecta]|uniref:Uncharacterized protein n=2 Tax=Winslowiella iniecta TaxID=1560201 RepID=A0A0L7T1M9_9GAMM|nr:hypothetical protein NG42_13385 [Winslowiella iniecta]KOC95359.1 hypothetical protein NG43_01250 [Winslowiella iniecta]